MAHCLTTVLVEESSEAIGNTHSTFEAKAGDLRSIHFEMNICSEGSSSVSDLALQIDNDGADYVLLEAFPHTWPFHQLLVAVLSTFSYLFPTSHNRESTISVSPPTFTVYLHFSA